VIDVSIFVGVITFESEERLRDLEKMSQKRKHLCLNLKDELNRQKRGLLQARQRRCHEQKHRSMTVNVYKAKE
jgi:hypothetical protein